MIAGPLIAVVLIAVLVLVTTAWAELGRALFERRTWQSALAPFLGQVFANRATASEVAFVPDDEEPARPVAATVDPAAEQAPLPAAHQPRRRKRRPSRYGEDRRRGANRGQRPVRSGADAPTESVVEPVEELVELSVEVPASGEPADATPSDGLSLKGRAARRAHLQRQRSADPSETRDAVSV